MEKEWGLAATFLAHAKVRFVPPEDTAAFERLLFQVWETSRARWPGVTLPAEPFVIHLAERLPEAGPKTPLEPLLQRLPLAELYLACACMRGIASAIELFERDYIAKLPRLLRRTYQSDAMIDDVCQLVRMKLLVPTPESGPKIAEYTGQGALMSWVLAIALRDCGKQKPKRDDSDPIPEPVTSSDPELVFISQFHREDFRKAVRQAFSVLTDDERYLLRLHVADRLSSYKLAALFRVDQSTISRRLERARQTLCKETQRCLQERLGLSFRDFESFLAVLDSQTDLGIGQLLRAEDGGPRPPEQG